MSTFASVPSAVAAIARGEIVVVVDDDDPMNEGDLVLAAAAATPEKLAFVVRHTSGVVCVSSTRSWRATTSLPQVTVTASAFTRISTRRPIAPAAGPHEPTDPAADCTRVVSDMSPTRTPRSVPCRSPPLQISLNLSIKQIKRVGRGFRNFDNYRLRLLLHCGGCNWQDQPAARLRARGPRLVA
ncbi:MAG: hypothetical protein GEU78_13620 [Actinobacteria bacterium]|nr:hypothetical protein [Actinomycetota bacterium]